MSSRLLPALLLLSGFCGISYEILYTKLLGNLLGNQFTISASVLLTFLLGIGLGTLYAHRFVRQLWLIEGAIGAYAAVMVLGYGWIDRLLYSQVPELATSLLVCALISIVLLVVPAFLVGCSVPLFAAYLSTLRSTHVFSITYAIYNFGAALTALVMEFVLLRIVGLQAATLWLAVLNAVVAVGLLFLVRSAPVIPPPRTDRLSFSTRTLVALATASVASAIFQLLMIKLAECFLGPYNETFSLVLAVVLLGIGVGALLAARFSIGFGTAVLTALVGLVGLLASLSPLATAYATLYPVAVQSYPLLVGLKFGLVVLMMGIPAVGFGATIPALLHEHRDVARESGQLLFVASMGNVVGFLLMAFVLHRYLDYGPLLVLIAALAGIAALLHHGIRHSVAWGAIALTFFGIAAWQGIWQESLLYYGHTRFQSPTELAKYRKEFNATERFKGSRDVFAITRRGDKAYFFINGYISIELNNASEKIVGGLSSMYAPRLDRALVLGLGSGATAGTVGLIFDHTDVVEINPVVIANQFRMAEYSFDIANQERVRILNDDGIHFMKTTPERYSLILNTVTTPLYFSSSKLYTRDFFEAVSSRLTDDGVYMTWVDRSIGDEGIEIILDTLHASFGHCWLNYLVSSYFLMACSDQELQLRQIAPVLATEPLRERLAAQHSLPLDLIPYHAISTDAFAFRDEEDSRLNTIDFPVLEHAMASVDRSTRMLRLQQRLREHLDLGELQRRLEPVFDWDPASFAFWASLRTNGAHSLAEILREAAADEFGDLSAPITEVARYWAANIEEVDEARAAYRYGRRLQTHGYPRAAIALLDRAYKLQPNSYRTPHYLGENYEALGELGRARAQYEEALKKRNGYRRSVEALERLDALDAGGPS